MSNAIIFVKIFHKLIFIQLLYEKVTLGNSATNYTKKQLILIETSIYDEYSTVTVYLTLTLSVTAVCGSWLSDSLSDSLTSLISFGPCHRVTLTDYIKSYQLLTIRHTSTNNSTRNNTREALDDDRYDC